MAPLPPVLAKKIPPQIVNEGAAFGPLDLKEFIQSPADSGELRFMGELDNNDPLPRGLICTASGLITGIPAPKTVGRYKFKITAENDAEEGLTVEFDFTIKERISMEEDLLGTQLKSKVWEAMGKNLPIPDLGEVLARPVSPQEVYYLLQRFATFWVWDVYNLDSPSEKQLLSLEGTSAYYNVWDRGSCIVAAPKDLFSHERTLEDALMTARAVAREVYKRGWVIEFAGFDKMVSAAWVELQLLSEKYGKHLEVLHFVPSTEDLKLYNNQFNAMVMRGG